MTKIKRADTNNERIARAIILSNTNRIQRECIRALGEIEIAIVKALDAKDELVGGLIDVRDSS